MKFFPKQHVSALVSHSLSAVVFIGGWVHCCILDADDVHTCRLETTATVHRALLLLACSLRPPMIELLVVSWRTRERLETNTVSVGGEFPLPVINPCCSWICERNP